MSMIPFIVTLLVLSTVNVDAQEEEAFANLKDENGITFGLMKFRPSPSESSNAGNALVDLDWQFTAETSTLSERFKVFLHDSTATADCTGDLYEPASYVTAECPTNEWGCIANEQGVTSFLDNPTEFTLPGTTVNDILSLSVAIYIDDEPVFCADIQQFVSAVAEEEEEVGMDDLGFGIEIISKPPDGVVEIHAYWNLMLYNVSQIQIHENPVIDGDCSTAGDIFNPAGRDGDCAYGDITCDQTIIESGGTSGSINRGVFFPFMDFQTLFCGGDRSVVVILDGETEPRHCYNFIIYMGPVYCPASSSPIAIPDISSAFGRGPYQSYFFAVVFCLCALYFQ